MVDDNEGANCFQWILKSNCSSQCLAKAAHKWNIDDSGEKSGKTTPLHDRYESHRSVHNMSQQAICFSIFMDQYTLTRNLILLRCANIIIYQFAFSIIQKSNDSLIVV